MIWKEEPSAVSAMNWLMVHGKKIGEECKSGDKDASAVIGQYQLLTKPGNVGDPALWAFLLVAIEQYCKSRSIPTPTGINP